MFANVNVHREVDYSTRVVQESLFKESSIMGIEYEFVTDMPLLDMEVRC
jgi:hypothetical protein